MTLILAIPCADSVVLASDGQVTSGEVRAVGRKLFGLTSHCAWAGSGEVALIQRVSELIGATTPDQTIEQLRDGLANAIRQSVAILLQLDFRTQFFQGNPDALLSLHFGDFVFVECRTQPKILHITSNGTPEWIDRFFATGNGANFAYALLQKYQGRGLTIAQASLLAFKVIEEAIEVGSYGLGPPIEIWHACTTGLRQVPEEEVAALQDAARQLREQEVQLLVPPPTSGLAPGPDGTTETTEARPA
jgi:proteasome beta subunit